jgi:hypothetical protein
MEEWQKQSLFSQNVATLIIYIKNAGFLCTFGEAYRTPEQAQIYAKEGKGIADSLHCKRLAIDLNLFSKDGHYLTDHDSYARFGEYWKTLHPFNRWGGDFPEYGGKLCDPDHFEMQDL